MKLVTNGRLITRNASAQGYYEHGAVAFEGTKIVEVGEEAMLRAKYPGAEIIDAKGGAIMPAFINAHTHIYSALARGLSIVGNNPTNFYEVLDGTWWAIDRHLMTDGTRASAAALYIDSIKQGVTTIFDHHASYGEIPGTLHTIAEESKRLGLRSCLCYEVSDRDGEEKCLQAIQENADFITECEKNKDPMLAAMFGGHALFTISDKTFDRMVAANNGRTGYHIHVSEGMNDVYDSLQNYGRRPVQRLPQRFGLLARGLADDPVDHLVVGMLGHANAHLDAGKRIGAQVLNDVLQPVVTAGGAAFANAQLACRQRNIVGDHHHMVRRHLIKPRRFAHRLAGEVHVGLGLHHQNFVAVFLQNTGPRLEPQLVEFEIFLFHQAVQRQPTHVVPGAFVPCTGIAKTHYQPSKAALLEKHMLTLL